MVERPILLLTLALEGEARARLEALAGAYELRRWSRSDDSALADGAASRVEVVVGWLSPALIQRLLDEGAPLRYLQAWSAGINGLPLEALAARGVYLCNASGVHSESLAEVALLGMLAFARRLPEMMRGQYEGRWMPLEGGAGLIHGRSLGILGVGAIGRHLARLAVAFGMRVLGLRSSGEALPEVERMFRPEEAEMLYRESDYIVNVLPDTEATRAFVDRRAFEAMPAHAVYVNIGRGSTTVTDDLVWALETGAIAGAALDVVDPEPLPEGHALWSLPNCIVMPHMGGVTPDYDLRALEILAENLGALEAGEAPSRNRVDYEAGY